MKILMVGVVAVGLASARPASAADVVFDPDGGGSTGTVLVSQFDQSAGNVIALNKNVTNINQGDTVDLMYQANLSNALLGSTVVVNGDGTVAGGGAAGSANFFTFTAQFSQVVLIEAGPALIFGLNPDPTKANTFTMYANTVSRGNDGTGAGFITTTKILEGTALTAPEVFSFQTQTPPCIQTVDPNCLLDPNNLNTTASVNPDTLYGFGSVNLIIDITYANPLYFPGFNLDTFFAFTSSDLTLPFRNVAPTDCFFVVPGGTDPNGFCTDPGEQLGISTVGTINGYNGVNTLIETDARTNFVSRQELLVPEPATMTLLGFGLFGAAAARRRQLRKAAQ